MTNWNEAKPESTDLIAEFPSVVTQQLVAFREGMEKHFFWTVSSGLSAGEPALSSASTWPGSARAFFGTQSQVSASKSGRLMLTSDTSRLYAVGTGAPSLLGSRTAIVEDANYTRSDLTASLATITEGTRWFVQSGTKTGAGTSGSVTFPTS